MRRRTDGIVRLAATAALGAMTGLLFASSPAVADIAFLVPKERVVRDVHVVGLAPLRLAAGIEHGEKLRGEIVAMLTRELEAIGLQVIASSEYGRIWRSNAKALGGVYDPVSGEPDKEKLKTCSEYTARELHRDRKVDAIVRLAVSEGPLNREWRDRVDFRGEWARSPTGVRGFFLAFVLEDLAGEPLYAIQKGIDWTEVHVSRAHERRSGDFPSANSELLTVQFILRQLSAAYGK